MDKNRHQPPPGVEMGVPVDKPGAYPQVPLPAGQFAPAQSPPPAVDQYGRPVQVDPYGRPVVTAIPMQAQPTVVANNANIRRDAQGNALCNKCSAPYPLPAGATSWRCRNCQELNNASVYAKSVDDAPPQQQQQQQQQPYPQATPAPAPVTAMPVDAYGRPIPAGVPVDAYGRPVHGVPTQVDAYGRPVHFQPVVTTTIANNDNIRRDAEGRALCRKCSTPYPLPAGCTSWRCKQCHELNNASSYECIIM
ncbi:TPA: hypothetical protein N0F65_009518 [Lagenidium giganteum]|uniref:Uncharacterized protein n=1 Tax=Lagenidium giganteum TaxID=4803 RepID=A0AAV2YSW8_9STRA|nr:TPA: hypothetical protein N0F65_009518 [Lagenidium giganteum]